jgi:tetratricopeptide (TPR) repeat protein
VSRELRRAEESNQAPGGQDISVLSADTSGREPAAYLGAGNALREAGRHDEAEFTLAQAAEQFPEHEQIAIARAWLANARRDWPTAISRWESFRVRFPDNPWGCLGHIHALRGAGRVDQVDPLLGVLDSLVAAAKLDPPSLRRLQLEVAKARLDWAAVRQAARALLTGEATPQAWLSLAQACWHLGDRDEADTAASQAIALDPNLADAVVVRAWVATDRGDAETALSCYRRLVELNPGTVRWSLKVIQLLNRLGFVKEALAELEDVRGRWPADPMVRMFLQNYGPAASLAAGLPEHDPNHAEQDPLRVIADKAPAMSEHRRSLIVPDPERDVLPAPVAHAQAAVLIFTGSNDAVSMPLTLFDRYLATLEITAIYLKDFRRLRFLLGIQSLGDDYPGTLSALREFLRREGVKRVCTIGNCDGGFAAIRYGVELGADRIVTFGAPTHRPQDALSRIEQARNFMHQRLAAKAPQEMMDLKPFLEGREHSSQIELFYEAEDARDRVQALHLAGLPGVTLHPQPGLSNHYLLRELALRSRDFRGMLSRLLGLAPPES